MKKLNVLLAILFLATTAFMTSCGEDDTATVIPKIVNAGTAASATYSQEDTVKVEVLVSSNVDLATFNVSANTVGATGSGITAVDPTSVVKSGGEGTNSVTFEKNTVSATISYEYIVPTSAAEGSSITLTMTATDDDGGQSAAYTVTFTVGTDAPDAKALSTVSKSPKMGATSSASGSFAAAATGDVYGASTAAGNAANIDFVYVYGISGYAGASDGSIVFAPSNTTYDDYFQASVWSGFSPRRATKLMASTIDFDAATDDSDLSTLTITGDEVKGLAANDVVAFETADGVRGLFKVTNLNSGSTGDITLSIKVVDDQAAKKRGIAFID